MDRPVTVRAGIGEFMANLILGVIGAIVTFTQLDDLIAQALATARAQGQNVPSGADALTHDTVRAVILVGSIVGLVILGLEAMFVWFAWKGRRTGRDRASAIGGFGCISGLFSRCWVAATSLAFLVDAQHHRVPESPWPGWCCWPWCRPTSRYRYRRRRRDTGQAH